MDIVACHSCTCKHTGRHLTASGLIWTLLAVIVVLVSIRVDISWPPVPRMHRDVLTRDDTDGHLPVVAAVVTVYAVVVLRRRRLDVHWATIYLPLLTSGARVLLGVS